MSFSSDRRSAYATKLRDPRWQKRRLEILQRDDWECQCCCDKETTLNVHHRWYENDKEPWDASDDALVTLCETCHQYETDNRRVYEGQVIRAMQKRFFAADLVDIGMLLEFMAITHAPEVVFTAMLRYLRDPDRSQAIVDWYLSLVQDEHREKQVQASEPPHEDFAP